MRRRKKGFAALLLAGLGAAGMASWRHYRAPSELPALDSGSRLVPQLRALFGEERPLTGRLGEGPARVDLADQGPSFLGFSGADPLLVQAELERRLESGRSVHNLHAAGLLRAFEGRLDEGVRLLEEARLARPEDEEVLADLSTLLLERGLREDRPDDLLRALEAVLEATRLAPAAAVPCFNLALVLDELGLEHQASEGWNRFLEIDSRSEWAAEARRRARDEAPVDRDETWAAVRDAVSRSVETGEEQRAATLLRGHSAEAREEVLESVLGLWAEAMEGGRTGEADRHLEFARVVGDISLGSDGDRLVADSVRAILAAQERGESLSGLVSGHRLLSEGVAARRAGDCARARPLLEDAEVQLGAGGSPLTALARLHRNICLYYESPEAAIAPLEDLVRALDKTPYPALRGRVFWTLGLAEGARRNYWTAVGHYRAAYDDLVGTNDRAGAAGALTLLAEAYQQLGQPQVAWHPRLEALRILTGEGDSAGADRTLGESVLALSGEGRLAAATAFQAEQIEYARRLESPEVSLSPILIVQAGLLRRSGQQREAMAALDEARALWSRLPPGATRDRLEAETLAAEALTLASLEPRRALAKFEEPIRSYSRSGYGVRLPELLGARASTRLATGDLAGAERDLLEALRRVETSRATTAPEAIRASSFELFQPIYDAAIRYYLRRDLPHRALEIADTAKGRALLDRPAASRPGSPEPAESPAAGISSSIPPGIVLVEYAVLPEELVIWVVSDGGTRHARVQVAAETLRAEVDLFRRSIAGGASAPELRGMAARLHGRLIRPVRDELRNRTTVVVVPDRFLTRVPFAALFDPQRERFLVEEHEVAVAPSAALLARSHDRRPTESPTRLALVVGNPSVDRDRFPGLTALDASEGEARQIADLYPRSDLLLGPAATPEQVLEGYSAASVVHFATHTRADDLGRSEILLASESAGNGILDLTTLDANDRPGPSVVYLSACTGAMPYESTYREGLDGPARAFLAARAPAVIASLWNVDDRSAAALAVAFHRELAGGSPPPRALQDAQLHLLRQPDGGFDSLAYWGAAQLFVSAWPETERIPKETTWRSTSK